MESREIEMSVLSNRHWLSFPEVDLYNVSVHIDIHIFNNLNYEIAFAKKNNVIYSNLKEVRRYCHDVLNGKFEKINLQNPILKREIVDSINKLEKNKITNRKTYLMKDNHTGLYKIGYSINPKKREQTLQSEKPSISLVKIWNIDIEKKLHDLYKNYRVRGEWFNLTKLQVQYICTHFINN